MALSHCLSFLQAVIATPYVTMLSGIPSFRISSRSSSVRFHCPPLVHASIRLV